MEKIKNENYILIQGWMINELQLKGNELLIYAIIYGFTQTENQLFSGSLQYLAEWTNSTKQGVIKCLKSLIDKEYIGKNEKYINNVKFCEYYTTKFNRVLNKVEQGIKQSLPNNIDYNIEDNKEYNTTTDTIYDFLQENGFVLTPIQCEVVDTWEDNELTRHAIKQAVLNNKFNINYIDKIIYSYKKDNIKTVQQAIEREEDFNNKRDSYYKQKYTIKESRQEREKRILEEMCRDD